MVVGFTWSFGGEFADFCFVSLPFSLFFFCSFKPRCVVFNVATLCVFVFFASHTFIPSSCSSLRFCRFDQLGLRVCCRQQVWVSIVVNMWLRHVVGSKVVSSCGCQVVKKRSPKIAPKHVVSRHGQKRGCELNSKKKVITATMRDRCL